MKKDSLSVDGKTYISSRRASEIAGYSKDYIGQLCREEKLICRRVNRLWWVDEMSLRSHMAETTMANGTSFKSPEEPRPVPIKVMSHPLTETAGEEFWVTQERARRAAAAREEAHYSSRRSRRAVRMRRLAPSLVALAMVCVLAGAYVFTFNFGGVSSEIAMLTSGFNRPIDQSAATLQSAGYGGLVVVPSQGSSTDAKLSQAIRNSFSDPVTVTAGQNNTQGIITPEFRTVKGHDYMYVMVPVQTASTTTQND